MSFRIAICTAAVACAGLSPAALADEPTDVTTAAEARAEAVLGEAKDALAEPAATPSRDLTLVLARLSQAIPDLDGSERRAAQRAPRSPRRRPRRPLRRRLHRPRGRRVAGLHGPILRPLGGHRQGCSRARRRQRHRRRRRRTRLRRGGAGLRSRLLRRREHDPGLDRPGGRRRSWWQQPHRHLPARHRQVLLRLHLAGRGSGRRHRQAGLPGSRRRLQAAGLAPRVHQHRGDAGDDGARVQPRAPVRLRQPGGPVDVRVDRDLDGEHGLSGDRRLSRLPAVLRRRSRRSR